MTRNASVPVLIAAIAAIVVLSLSIHVVMLQLLWVPYPDTGELGRWARLIPMTQALGIVWLAAAVVPTLERYHPMLRWLIVAALFAGMNGIVRNALMQGVTTTAYVLPAATLLFQAIVDLALAGLAVIIVSAMSGTIGRVLGGVLLAVAWLFVILPAVGKLLAPLMRGAAAHAHPEVFGVPYGANVLIPSYLSFAETVTATLIARFLIVLRPVRHDPHGLLRYAVLVLLVRGTLMITMFGPVIGADPGAGLLSVSQFLLQDLAMILLIQWLFVRSSGAALRSPPRDDRDR